MKTTTNIFTVKHYPWGNLTTYHAGLLTLTDAYLDFEPTNNRQKELKDAIISHITEGYGDFTLMSLIPMSKLCDAQQEMKRLQIEPNKPGDYTMYLACMLKVLVDNNTPVWDAWDAVCGTGNSYISQDVFNMADTPSMADTYSILGKNSVGWITLD